MLTVVADENIPLIHEFFADWGVVHTHPGRTLTAAQLAGADALIVRSVTPVNAALLAQSSVKFVGTCTIGVDHLDQELLNKESIAWSSAPGCNANSVVEYVYAALAHLNEPWIGKRVGIIGAGRVGGTLYRRLKAQGVDVVCYDPNLTARDNPDLVDLETLLASDIISMHTPLVKDGPHPSLHLLGETQLRQLRPGAVLINAGRGAVIDNQALKQVLRERPDLRVVLDVWEPEPQIDLELVPLVKIATPHIAGYSYDGKLNGTEMIYQAACKAFDKVPTQSLAQLVPPLNTAPLSVDPTATEWQTAQSLIARVYDIAADDARLREAARAAHAFGDQASAAIGAAFDLLRKHYPRRREFHNYQVALAPDAPVRSWLSALGFGVVNSTHE